MKKTALTNTEFRPEDDYPLLAAPGSSPYNHETFNLWGYDPTERLGVHMHLVASGGEFSRFRATVVVFDGEDVYAREFVAAAQPQGLSGENIHVTNIEPLKRWRYEFLGLLAKMTPASSATTTFEDAPQENVAFNLDIEMVGPPIEQGSQGDDGVHASSGTVARLARRYEQLARIRGAVRIGSRQRTLGALGIRIHRRNSANNVESGTVGHSWLSGSFPSGRGFHFLGRRHNPDGRVGSLTGLYYDGKTYHEAEVLKYPHYSGDPGPESYEIEFRADGKTMKIQGLPAPPYMRRLTREIMQKVGFSRAPGHFLFDGEVGGGVLERSLRGDFPVGGYFQA